MIDLRSDTVTQPTAEMRQVMAEAAVGDDVFGDDPTVLELEAETASLLGKEAAVFVPSGTMSNQIAIRIHTNIGDEIFIDANAHVYYYEAGGPAALSGVMTRLLNGESGIFSARDVQNLIRPADQHFPATRLLCLENTHNRGGGKIWPLEAIRQVVDCARGNELATHLDGARLWNAAAASDVPENEIANYFDTVSVCFSKGLGAPVGSALVGSEKMIRKARRVRKQLGGGMRQAGIIAAGALYAIRNHRARLKDDHENAILLAKGLSEIRGLEVKLENVETNIVFVRLTDGNAEGLVQQLSIHGIGMLALGRDEIRAVTHLGVSRDDIEATLKAVKTLFPLT